MLHGVALARAGEPAAGLRELTSASRYAVQVGAHRAVVAEIAHSRALACYLLRDYETALRYARQAEQADADVISVRAMQLRGFVAVARQEYREALDLFRRTLRRYRTCDERDDDLGLQTVHQVAVWELHLRSAKEPGTHRYPESRRIRAWEPTYGTFSLPQMLTQAMDGWQFALDGDAAEASQLLRRSAQLAPSMAWKMWALAQQAALANEFGERHHASGLLTEALEMLPKVPWHETVGEERVALLLLAEVAAAVAPAFTADLLGRYDALPTMDPNEVLATDPRMVCLDRHIRGVAARAAGDLAAAAALLTDAVRGWRATGCRWRTAMALIELDAATVGAELPPSVTNPRVERDRFYSRRCGEDRM